MKLYQAIARNINNSINHQDERDNVWIDNLEIIINDHFPSGSGFDGETYIDIEKSTAEKIVIYTEYHHMNENGYYDGWSRLKIVVKPSLLWDYSFKITGIKRKYSIDRDYFMDIIGDFLEKEIETKAKVKG